MSDPASAAPVAPAAEPTSIQPPAAVTPAPVVAAPVAPAAAPTLAPAPAAQPPADDGKEPGWLPARLERERKAILKELGVTDVKDAKSALDAYRAHTEAQKTEAQRLAEENARLKAAAAELDEYKAAVAAQTAAELGKLTPEQREVVLALAGESPAAQAKAIAKLKPTWAAAAPQPAPVATQPAHQPAEPPKPPPLPAPASTSAAVAPPPPQVRPSENHLATWEQLKANAPYLASAFYLENYAAISAAQKARGA